MTTITPDEGLNPPEPPRTDAIICRPVIWLDDWHHYDYGVENPHLTLLYFDDVKDTLLHDFVTTMRRAEHNALSEIRKHRLVKVTDIGAYGPDKDYPVLEIGNIKGDPSYWLHGEHREFQIWSNTQLRLVANRDYSFSPHVTVNVKTLTEPPKRLVLGPVEVWWKGEEKVKL